MAPILLLVLVPFGHRVHFEDRSFAEYVSTGQSTQVALGLVIFRIVPAWQVRFVVGEAVCFGTGVGFGLWIGDRVGLFVGSKVGGRI